MLRILFFFILVCFISCAEKQETNLENSSSTSYDLKELELYKKPKDLFLYLKYDSTALIENDVTLFFTFSVINATNDTMRLLCYNCPYFDPFIIYGTEVLNFNPEVHNLCFSTFLTYKYFNPIETTSYILKLKLEDGIQRINGHKVRVGFKGYFGGINQSPYELYRMYSHIDVIDIKDDFPMYWSNYVLLKDDFIHVK